MPTFEISSEPFAGVEADALAVFAAKGEDGAELTAEAVQAGEALEIDLAAELKGVRFEGDLGAVARIPTRGAARVALLLVIGMGKPSEASLETLRKAAGSAARAAAKDSSLAIAVPSGVVEDGDSRARAQAVAEGAGLGAYAFTAYRTKTNDTPSLEAIVLLPGEGDDADDLAAGMGVGQILVRATSLARDLVNEPPGHKRPPALAERIEAVAREAGLGVRVFDEEALAEGGFGGILGVGQGSSVPPRLVELSYEPEGSQRHVVLAGKGITFDSGGLSLKPSSAMNTMKSDMSGAAAVVAAMSVLGELEVRVRVTGLVALAENMPSGTAIRVSDVLTHRGGKTVEVMNTDAEGRLVLADALAYGAEAEPDAMIDLATLTGAQVVALGSKISAVMGTDAELVSALLAAAEQTGERLWELPLASEYADHLKSEVADMKNIGKAGQAGTIIGGLFLKEFAGSTAWAHMDIAGPAFTEEGDGHYLSKGGTGVPVRTLVRYLQSVI